MTGGPTVYTVTASTGTGDGSLGLNLNSSGTGITDTAMKRFGLTYGPRAKPRWWLLESFGRWWQRLRQ